jgi:hypothetical protein
LPQLSLPLPEKKLYVQPYDSPPGMEGLVLQFVDPAGHCAVQLPAHPVKYVANVAKPKFTSPENACTVCRNAHLASLSRDGMRPHEFGVAPTGHVAGN